MSCNEGYAAEKFWRNPHLVEQLLPFLDVDTTLQLALSKVGCTLQVLQRSSVWKKLIKRTFPSNSQIQQDEDRIKIKCLVEILKMMKEPNSYILVLLEAVCEKIPSLPDSTSTGEFVKISCPWHEFHSISPLDFMILEEAEAVVGSAAVQEIKSLKGILKGPLLSAIAARLSRQQGKITTVSHSSVLLDSPEVALWQLTSLVKKMEHTEQTRNSFALSIDNIKNADMWAGLATVLSTAPAPGCVHYLSSDREALREAKREDLKKVWDSLSSVWSVWWGREGRSESKWFYKDPLQQEFAGWKELEEMLDKFNME